MLGQAPRLWMLIAAGAAVIGGAAYFGGAFDLLTNPQEQVETSEKQAAAKVTGNKTNPSLSISPALPEVETPQSDKENRVPQQRSETDKQEVETVLEAQPGLPGFDIVRAEPDGSLLIAGQAEPNSKIKLIAGDKTIAEVQSSQQGEFVAVLDDPLKPGDYVITLEQITKDGERVVSEQTAIVSIPQVRDGQVLALVKQSGEASRLITTPQAAVTAPDVSQKEKLQDNEVEVAKVEPGRPVVTEAKTPTEIVIEAVEIEGDLIFVAGKATPGRLLRIYANEVLLGQARTNRGGRFLIEAKRALAVGQYIIRADMIDGRGKVLARVAVPFNRPPGEKVAAVSDNNASSEPEETGPVSSPKPTTQSNDVPKAGSAATRQQAEESKPKTVQTADVTAPKQTVIAQATESVSVAKEMKPLDKTRPQPQQHSSAPATQGGEGRPVTVNGTDSPAEPDIISTAATTENANEPSTNLAPALKNVDHSVVIRRGDTLWHISARVYGHGLRYSTIYLANQEQIRDPDMIWPGQVFDVPDTSSKGEAADWSVLEERRKDAQPLPTDG